MPSCTYRPPSVADSAIEQGHTQPSLPSPAMSSPPPSLHKEVVRLKLIRGELRPKRGPYSLAAFQSPGRWALHNLSAQLCVA
eukprot:356872-Chlamydomonas_euryale.AAC.7